MDPMTLVFILAAVGAWNSMKAGGRAVRAARSGASRAAVPRSTRSGGKAGGGMPSWFNRSRHTGTGWWASEVGHGFPVLRHGLGEGWAHHQTAMAKRQAARTKARADGAERQLTYRQEIDAHQKRIDAARQEDDKRKAAAAAAKPATPAKPAAPSGGTAAGGHSGRPGVMSPPASSSGAGGHPAAAPASPHKGDPTMAAPGAACTDTSCSCHASTGTTPAGSSTPTGGSTVSDTTYEGTLEACDKIAQALDLAVNNDELKSAQTLADGLGPMLPDDTESLGVAADLVSAIQQAQQAMATAKEKAELLKQTVEKNHGAANEAATATGHMAEREFHTAG